MLVLPDICIDDERFLSSSAQICTRKEGTGRQRRAGRCTVSGDWVVVGNRDLVTGVATLVEDWYGVLSHSIGLPAPTISILRMGIEHHQIQNEVYSNFSRLFFDPIVRMKQKGL
jgi:hypothetical protein